MIKSISENPTIIDLFGNCLRAAVTSESAAREFPAEIERLSRDFIDATIDLARSGGVQTDSALAVIDKTLAHIDANDALGRYLSSQHIDMGKVLGVTDEDTGTLLHAFADQLRGITKAPETTPVRPSLENMLLGVHQLLIYLPDRSKVVW